MADSTTKKRINQLIREAQRTKDVYRARELFQQALEIDPSSEKANLWMATVSDDKDQREYYIQRVLEINPRNRIAPYLRRVRTPEERLEQEQSQTGTLLAKKNNLMPIVIIFCAFSMFVMGIMIFNLVKEYESDTYLAENGYKTLATITDKTERHDDDYSYYYLWYTFEANYKDELVSFDNVKSEVQEAVYDYVQIGEQYEITYLPEDPTVAQLSKLADSPALQEQFTRELILYSFAATLPIDIGVIVWLIQRASRKRKDEEEYAQKF